MKRLTSIAKHLKAAHAAVGEAQELLENGELESLDHELGLLAISTNLLNAISTVTRQEPTLPRKYRSKYGGFDL